MRRILLATLLLFSISVADTMLIVKKGWQLIGSATPLNDMSKFKVDSVEQVWHFDADTQKWLGYSPDAKIQSKMSEKGISKLTNLKSWHGFWVKSKKEWTLILPDKNISKNYGNENSPNDIIYLKKGWNLISLPIDSVVSPDIFKGMTVWKYDSNREWEVFDRDKSIKNFPKLAHIKNSDGLWVKVDRDTNISVMEEASKLHNFKTYREMKNYIKSSIEINQRPICGYEPIYLTRGAVNTAQTTMADSATLEGDSEAVKNSSDTNLQEIGVDEADILKHNRNYIFYTKRGEYNQKSYINITSFREVSKGSGKPINQIAFDKNRYIDSFYLIDNRLVVLSNINNSPIYQIVKDGDREIPPPNNPKEQIVIDIFDVSDIKDIKNISSYRIDGDIVTSRVIGDNLYLVSHFYPKYSVKYPKKYITLSETCKEYFENIEDTPPQFYPTDIDSSENKPYNPDRYAECYSIHKERDTDRYYRYDYENPILTVIDLLPDIEGDNLPKRELIKPQRLYTSSKQDQNGDITTISTIKISNGKYQLSNSFMGYSSIEYASSKALYLISNQYPIYYDFNNYKERSSIYKFNLDNNLTYRAIGYVYGHALNQFSLSEYRDILRIATTEGFSWRREETKNSIYTLKEDNGLLSIQGGLSGLGKEGEVIKSVRFIGDKGYVVTFRATDPLYTIDISDPKAPKRVGELKVSGYSAYLHPVGDNKLLGIGRNASSDGRVEGVKIELFDISDFANPISLDSIVLDRYTSSELENNHKALAYRESDNLFAFPYHKYENYTNYNYLGVYQIKDNSLISYPKIESSINNWSEGRGLIFDMDNITYISFFVNGEVVKEKLEER